MPTKTKFSAGQFKATEHATVQDKAKFANHFVKFVLSGFDRKKFPKWFYVRLSMTFGHIAHYNQNGFYETWFATADTQREFIDRLRNHTSYGQPEYTFVDVERQLIHWANTDGREEIDNVLNQNADAQQRAIESEQKRMAAIAGQETQQFKVAAKSQNTGGFGHRQYVVMAKDGSAFKLNIVPSNLSLAEGQVIDVPLHNGSPKWDKFYVECPERLANAPQAVIDEVWGK